jgi:23S rRNA U2552 (ribose-2'-O)-methylase RlmE/FtsJ
MDTDSGRPDGATAHVLVRVWLPDRPGALGQVASRIGAVRGDIVGVDVLERGENVAVDEFAVDLADVTLVDQLIREIEEVDGASVEEVRVVGTFPDPRLDALASAEELCNALSVADLQSVLVAHTRREFLTEWAALVGDDLATPVVVGEGAPSPDTLLAFAHGAGASPMVANGTSGPEDLAVAIIPNHAATLLLGRDGHPFRKRERYQLLALTRIADRAWTLLEASATR